MIPPGECMYAGRKRRKPIQKQPSSGSEKSNPSKRHRDRLNAELDRLASLLPFPPEIITKLDKLSILRLSVSYLRVKNFFQAIEEQHSKKQPCQPVGHAIKEDNRSSGTAMPEGELLLESLNGFALVVSTEGMIFYASSTILDYLGFHQTDVMHQNVYDYIHVDDRQEFCRQLHWAMNPQQMVPSQESQTETGEDFFLNKLFKAQESNTGPSEYSSFLNRYFICRVRCLLDSTSGFLTMQFEGKLKFLFGQKKKASSGTVHPPQMALFCIAVPLLLPSVTDLKMKSVLVRTQKKPGATSNTDNTAKPLPVICEGEHIGRNGHQGACFPNMLHNAENQIKLMNAGDNGMSLVKVRANEDQWLWVEANAPLLYRNRSSDYLVVTPQSQREEEQLMKKHTNMTAMKNSRDTVQDHGVNEAVAHLKHHLAWGKQEKEDIKVKFQPAKSEPYLADETNIFSKHFSNVQNHCNINNGWAVKNPANFRSSHQLIGSSSNRTNRSFYSTDQSHSGTHVVGRPARTNSEHFQSYGLQQHPIDSYLADNIKLESSYVSPEIMYDSGIPLNVPIKIENDSDSEGRPDFYSEPYAHCWLGEGNTLKKTMLDFPEGLHLKTETDISEQMSCLKPKHHILSPHRGHCFMPANHINHINVNRPLKGVYNKEAAQFCPQKCAYLESMLSLQGADCFNSPFYGAASVDDKIQGDGSYKLQCEFKAHSLVQNIKREPLDSPPWPDSEQQAVPAIYQKNTLMGFLPSQMQRNAAEFAYIQ
ncbi:aryl hydrocarbon receptor repressor isoform X2 [Spea bombifrons]|uniref:aryl hydrocarbon receptor repressor isoform X2 n=1 Tax=Spea bombifrons TaxID=233779 RepID=UPI0023495183|nr:aryl hydrocarbon receptor repressor isoform X2 [Spea bombifrons]